MTLLIWLKSHAQSLLLSIFLKSLSCFILACIDKLHCPQMTEYTSFMLSVNSCSRLIKVSVASVHFSSFTGSDASADDISVGGVSVGVTRFKRLFRSPAYLQFLFTYRCSASIVFVNCLLFCDSPKVWKT